MNRSIAGKPNIVMIISDDQAWGDYGFMGHLVIKTPHPDELAAESLTFRRGYVPSSLCCPSLASIITGRFPHQHKVTSNDPPVPAGMKPAEFQRSPAPQNEPDGKIEVYNLKADPSEEINLPDAEMERVAKMREKLDAWWKG